MHIFDYSILKDELVPVQLVNLTANVTALKVMSGMRRENNAAAFHEMEMLAKIESVKASNAIEGIITTDERIRELVKEGSKPQNHTEGEIAGYRDVLNEIHQNHAVHDFTENDIHAFHAQMMRLANPDTSKDEEAMRQLVLAYAEARDDAGINKLLLIPCVILDFLCIHPFGDGNGRLSRLLTLLLLYRNGFDAGKYVSFEGVINAHKAEYYEALRESSVGWNENKTRYFPFMINFLTTLYGCYSELDRRFASVHAKKVSKKKRITATVLNSFTPLGKKDICRILPDVSPTTVELVLGELVREGRIRKVGSGRSTAYLKA